MTDDQQTSLTLPTTRLTLIEITPDRATNLSLGGPGGFTWIAGGPEEGTRTGAGIAAKAAAEGAYVPGWGAYALVRRSDGRAVGAMGFHGPPLAGQVEIGYDVVASARRQGYATEALQALAAWALTSPEVTLVFARTEPGNLASQGVLDRAGFTRASETAEGPRFELRA
ncbi:GNAT family N-acetyltransferase [Streptomyces sp. NBC_01304]|uniref:GNAT family N-acetyltransferase n=1 Tax=Streptomyces sp. NBC_01304 TaxID=2903818 RepID=UPI002E0F639E|nr:GNAT family N-acetyltransferase [Streptomyces sp. NBC_01304]